MILPHYDINEEDFLLPDLVKEILNLDPPINAPLEIETNTEKLMNEMDNHSSPSSLNPHESGISRYDAAREYHPVRTMPEIDTNIEVLAKKLQELINPSSVNSSEKGFWRGGFATSEWVHPQNPLVQSNKENEKNSGETTFLEKTGGTGVFLPLSASSSSSKEPKYQFGRSGVSLSNQNNKKYTKCVGDNRKTGFKGVSKEIEESGIELTLSLKRM